MRLAALVSVLAGAALAAACERKPPPGGEAQEAAAFAARCAALSGAPAEVAVAPVVIVDDGTRSRADLTGMYDRARPGHETMGLTQTRATYDTRVEFAGLRERVPDRACVRPRIRVTIAMSPMTVFVARDLADDDCRRAVVHEHEMKHVEVYKLHLTDAAERLRETLNAAFSGRAFEAATPDAAQEEAARAVARVIDDFELDAAARLRERQAEVDTPEEYLRVAAACPAP